MTDGRQRVAALAPQVGDLVGPWRVIDRLIAWDDEDQGWSLDVTNQQPTLLESQRELRQGSMIRIHMPSEDDSNYALSKTTLGASVAGR